MGQITGVFAHVKLLQHKVIFVSKAGANPSEVMIALYFIRNLQMAPISYYIKLHLDRKACRG
jgi:hypothetical protein